MKVQRGGGKKSSGRYQVQYEEEFYYEEDAEGEDESDVRHRWPARSADGKFRVRHCKFACFPQHSCCSGAEVDAATCCPHFLLCLLRHPGGRMSALFVHTSKQPPTMRGPAFATSWD